MIKNLITVKSFLASLSGTALALLGFSSCSDENGGDDVLLMYDTPYTTYEIKGSVVDEMDHPVENAEITVKAKYIHACKLVGIKPVVTTDVNGNYRLEDSADDLEKYYTIICSPQQEDLAVDSVNVTPVFSNGDGGWFLGNTVVEQNFRLKSKKTTD